MSHSSQLKTLETHADIRRHEMLQDLAEASANHLIREHAVDQAVACDLGNTIADFLCNHWKGQNVYIPADTPFKMSARDLEIYRRMERGNAPDLAREFNLSFVRVYQIYRRMLAINRARLQPGLFGDDAGKDV
jgi:Mor family transcriptional regulator